MVSEPATPFPFEQKELLETHPLLPITAPMTNHFTDMCTPTVTISISIIYWLTSNDKTGDRNHHHPSHSRHNADGDEFYLTRPSTDTNTMIAYPRPSVQVSPVVYSRPNPFLDSPSYVVNIRASGIVGAGLGPNGIDISTTTTTVVEEIREPSRSLSVVRAVIAEHDERRFRDSTIYRPER